METVAKVRRPARARRTPLVSPASHSALRHTRDRSPPRPLRARDVCTQVGFKMFLGVTATCSNWSTDASGSASECSLVRRAHREALPHRARAQSAAPAAPLPRVLTVRSPTSVRRQVLEEIPFVEYVELPASLSELRYSNILCGVIKGALEQIGIKVDVNFVRDMLRGDDAYEMRVVLVEAVPDEFPFKDDE